MNKVGKTLRAWGVLFFFVVTGLVACYSHVTVKNCISTNSEISYVIINFLLPMRHDILPSISIDTEMPASKISWGFEWTSKTTAVLTVKKLDGPEGQLIKYSIRGSQSFFPYIKKNLSGEFRLLAPLKYAPESPGKRFPTRGPIPVFFNSPVDVQTLKTNIVLPQPGQLKSVKVRWQGKEYTDLSRWYYYPDKPLAPGTSNIIILNRGISNMSGITLENRIEIPFITAIPPKIMSVSPSNGEKGVRLYRKIEFAIDRELYFAKAVVSDPEESIIIPGETLVKGKTVSFVPARAFLPGKTYKVLLTGESNEHEPIDSYTTQFTTVETGDRIWVDVTLGDIHTARVYRGTKLMRHILVSGGTGETPTPLGYFYCQDRGHSFWSPRFGEGATYWVRLMGQVLVHSVPRDSRWQVKEDQHAKLGLPASHGCIRMDEKDAKWFYENIPAGTLVIIHQ